MGEKKFELVGVFAVNAQTCLIMFINSMLMMMGQTP